MRNLIVNRWDNSFVRVDIQRYTRRQFITSKLPLLALILAGTIMIAAHTEAALIPTVIYQQDFNAGLPVGEMTSVNTPTATGTVSASAGAAQLSTSSSAYLSYLTNDTFTTESFTIDVDLNQLNGTVGGTVSGITVGNRAYSFFPGFTNGAFNVHNFNPNTAQFVNQIGSADKNMGFTPAQGVYHHFRIDVNPLSGDVDVRVYQNGNLLSTPYLYQQVADANFIPGKIGFWVYSQSHNTLFDNLTVTALRPEPAPEPSSALLLGLGLVGLSLRRKARRG